MSRRWLPAAALLLALGAFAYFTLVYLPSVARFNQEQGYSAGSDLYSRWYGTRELLLHGRDPYSAEITAEMQRGFVGRDPLPGETLPEWSVFAQPLYTVFLVAPLAPLDFETVRLAATIAFPLLIALGGLLWMLALHKTPTWPDVLTALLLSVSAPATLYAASFQQLGAVVFLLLAGAFWLVTRGRLAWAGPLLALSTIKPQESWLLIAMLLGWALFSWRERRGLIISFALSMAALLLAAELLLPGWIFKFLDSVQRYSQQTAGLALFATIVPGPLLLALAGGWLLLLGWLFWRVRGEAGRSVRLALAAAAALAITVVMIPAYLQYERIFLLPALFALLWIAPRETVKPLTRAFLRLAVALLLAPWLLATIVALLQLAGMPIGADDAVMKALPWLPYAVLPYLAAAALVALLNSTDESGDAGESSANV